MYYKEYKTKMNEMVGYRGLCENNKKCHQIWNKKIKRLFDKYELFDEMYNSDINKLHNDKEFRWNGE